MARNEEKHAGRLNRLWLQKLDDEKREKNPTRPGLGSLHTAEDVKKWIPSIKKDIDFCLKQSQVGCYPERHITEFSEKIERLTKEYKAYIRKLRELEPKMGSIPWTDRPYARKHKVTNESQHEHKLQNDEEPANKSCKSGQFVSISTPLLDSDETYTQTYGYIPPQLTTVSDICVNSDLQDKPLEFSGTVSTAADTDTDYDVHVNSDLQDTPLEFSGTVCAAADTYTGSNCTVGDSQQCNHDLSSRDGSGLKSRRQGINCGSGVTHTGRTHSHMGKNASRNICACRHDSVISRTSNTADDVTSSDFVRNLPDKHVKDVKTVTGNSYKGHNPLNLAYSDSSSDDEAG